MHNPKAGDGKHGKTELVEALAKAGHHAIYQSTKKRRYEDALKEPTDLVLAAGGDGTVAKVARRLIESGFPLSVLPLGTANNLARSLGFSISPEEIIARLDAGKKRSFDIGLACGACGKRYFFESVGGGLLADYVRAAKGKGKKAEELSKEEEMKRHVLVLRRLLKNYPAWKWKIDIDSEDISDHYILWEAMNIRSVGPVLDPAPHAASDDGWFDFVCARETDRPLLIHHLNTRLAGKRSKFPLPTRRFRHLRIVWKGSTLHFDDKLRPPHKQKSKRPSEIEITVKPSALIVLQPG
jgi:diacylglycerol kinase (ATP)